MSCELCMYRSRAFTDTVNWQVNRRCQPNEMDTTPKIYPVAEDLFLSAKKTCFIALEELQSESQPSIWANKV